MAKGIFQMNSFLLCAAIGSVFVSKTLMANAIDDLPVGHWLEVPSSKLRNIDPDIYAQSGYKATFDRNFRNIILSWNGGAYDTKRDRLIIWGGGHNDYPGNGIYSFDINSLTWMTSKPPSTSSLFSDWQNLDKIFSDGSPVSRHTYDYLEYIPPPVDRFISAGGSALWQTSFLDFNTYLFDSDSGTWEVSLDDVPNADVGAISGYDNIAKKVWLHGGFGPRNFLSSYDALSATWREHGDGSTEFGDNGYVAYQWTGAVDPVRRKFVAIGNVGRTSAPLPAGAIYVWDISREGYTPFHFLITRGATEILETENPGFAYDPVSDKFIAWSGTTQDMVANDNRLDPEPYINPADIYVLDMDTAMWIKVSPLPSNTVIPTPATSQGTYGRFRYVPSKNVFVLVNSVDENVFVYRLTDKATKTVPNAPGALSASITILP